MSSTGIRIDRFPYEEPYHLNLRLRAMNGDLSGSLEYYCNADDLTSLGNQLVEFSGKAGDEISYVLGSEKNEDRFAFFLALRIWTLDLRGHCALGLRLNNNQKPPANSVSEFSMTAEVADINRLGRLLIQFGQLKHAALEWSIHGGELFVARD